MPRDEDPLGVEVSTASCGEVAAEPDSIESVHIDDEDGNEAGYLIKWGSNEWIFAESDSHSGLNERE